MNLGVVQHPNDQKARTTRVGERRAVIISITLLSKRLFPPRPILWICQGAKKGLVQHQGQNKANRFKLKYDRDSWISGTIDLFQLQEPRTLDFFPRPLESSYFLNFLHVTFSIFLFYTQTTTKNKEEEVSSTPSTPPRKSTYLGI